MRSRTRNWIHFGIVLALMAGTQTGCKSGWKMPSSDMFSWGRKPDSTVIGSGPTVTTPGAPVAMSGKTPGSPTAPTSNSPLSPSLRSTPNQINSTALNGPTPTRSNSSNLGGYGPNTSAPTLPGTNGSGLPGASPYGAMTGTAPTPGGAAASNGYTTGAYATNQPRLGAMPALPYGQSSPYGQMPSMTVPQMPAPQMPAPQMPIAQSNVPNQPLPGGPGFSYPLPSGPAPQSPQMVAGLPNASVPPTGVPNGFNMIPPPSGTQAIPALPVSNSNSLPPSLPPATQMPVAYGGGAPSSMPTVAPQTAARNGAYQPGSIGRSTSYDFSNQGPGSLPTAPVNTLPRTATDPTGSMNR
jgi:hypothetical protein